MELTPQDVKIDHLQKDVDNLKEDVSSFRDHVIRCDERQQRREKAEKEDRDDRKRWENRLDRYIKWGGGVAVSIIVAAAAFAERIVTAILSGL